MILEDDLGVIEDVGRAERGLREVGVVGPVAGAEGEEEEGEGHSGDPVQHNGDGDVRALVLPALRFPLLVLTHQARLAVHLHQGLKQQADK